MNLLPIKSPKYNIPVTAIIKHSTEWNVHVVNLVYVLEDDVNWRYLEDNCELAYDRDVIYWEYKKE